MVKLTSSTIRSVAVGVLGIAFIQAVLGGAGMMVAALLYPGWLLVFGVAGPMDVLSADANVAATFLRILSCRLASARDELYGTAQSNGTFT